MTWGVPSPPVVRIANAFVDDRFEKILAQLANLESHTAALHVQNLDSRKVAIEAISRLMAQHYGDVGSQLGALLVVIKDHQASTELNFCQQRQQLALVESNLEASIGRVRAHVWDDLWLNLRQRVAEVCYRFMAFLTRPLF